MNERDPLKDAIAAFRRLPNVGARSATRIVYWLLRASPEVLRELRDALDALARDLTQCTQCGAPSTTDPCPICGDPRRDRAVLCVVEHPQDVLAFERSGEFRGRYHILHGAISPLEGVGPADLNLRPLLARLRDPSVTEVILATDADVEGDATALYLARLLGDLPIRVTRLAHGVAVGTEIEFADAVSLARALRNRQAV